MRAPAVARHTTLCIRPWCTARSIVEALPHRCPGPLTSLDLKPGCDTTLPPVDRKDPSEGSALDAFHVASREVSAIGADGEFAVEGQRAGVTGSDVREVCTVGATVVAEAPVDE